LIEHFYFICTNFFEDYSKITTEAILLCFNYLRNAEISEESKLEVILKNRLYHGFAHWVKLLIQELLSEEAKFQEIKGDHLAGTIIGITRMSLSFRNEMIQEYYLDEGLLGELERVQRYDKFEIGTLQALDDLVRDLSVGRPETYDADSEQVHGSN